MKMTGAEFIVRFLEDYGIETIAGIPGGSNLPLYDALGHSRIRHVLARHEQGAGFIAQGMARVTGRPAVCFATSGPGATNLVTALADAKLDSVPIVAITGQVPTGYIGTDAFQEIDTFGMTLPITKHNFLVKDADELRQALPEAFRIAVDGRPGPVLVDVPKDVQQQTIEYEGPLSPPQPGPSHGPDEARLAQAVDMIARARRPVLYAGGGIVAAGAHAALNEFAHHAGIPVVCTLMGLGCMRAGDPLFAGMLGMHGARYTNHLLREADLLIAVGVRFDDRATGHTAHFCPEAAVIHIDVDASELNKIRTVECAIAADAGVTLRRLTAQVKGNNREQWQARLAQLRLEFPPVQAGTGEPLHPVSIMRMVRQLIPSQSIVTTDVGQHQMWCAQSFDFYHPRTFLTSGGLGTMGFGLPAAIGAALAARERRVVCFSGDGSLLMNIQELVTLAELDLDVTVFVFNNGHLGLVRQQQELFYARNYVASRFDRTLDFAWIAQSFGVHGMRITQPGDIGPVFDNMRYRRGPQLIDVVVDHAHNVYPMVPPGKGNHEMIG